MDIRKHTQGQSRVGGQSSIGGCCAQRDLEWRQLQKRRTNRMQFKYLLHQHETDYTAARDRPEMPAGELVDL